MTNTSQHWILLVVMLALGLVVGYLLPKPLKSAPDQEWQQLFNEEKDHKRIEAFQYALAREGSPKDTAELSKQLDAQLRIEDLIVNRGERIDEWRDLAYSASRLFKRRTPAFRGD